MEKLSNEELATRIKAGERDLMGQLWEQVYPFIFKQAGKFYQHAVLELGSVRYEVEDLTQQAYFALENAVRYYGPEKAELSFLTVLNVTLKTAFAEVAGIRSSKRDALLYAESGDAPINEEGNQTLFDTIEDPRQDVAGLLEDPELEQRRRDLHDTLEGCLAQLPEDQKKILRLFYYFGRSEREIGERLNVTPQTITNRRRKALQSIEEDREQNGLLAFLDRNTNFYSKISLARFKSSGERAVEAIVIQREEKAKRWLQKHGGAGAKLAGRRSMNNLHCAIRREIYDTDPGRNERDLQQETAPPGSEGYPGGSEEARPDR